jgi:EAL domain-containing protein (putative c-di-GMP-specific phosphodiesterase class I)
MVETPALWVAYQPLVDLASGRWVGAEALARWNHPALGPINPAEFVSIAEQSELIHTLGHRTMVAACRDAILLRACVADFQMSVNLSVRQLDDSRLVEEVQEVLERSGLPPSGLCLEVTESSLAVDEQLAGRTLTALRGLGVSVAIDDFGTGYSSLARLRALPVNELKIDRSFVTTLPTDPQARHIVAGIVALGHGLDMRVVAEGVETAEHAEILAELGCDLAQGYLYARPVAIEGFDLGGRSG